MISCRKGGRIWLPVAMSANSSAWLRTSTCASFARRLARKAKQWWRNHLHLGPRQVSVSDCTVRQNRSSSPARFSSDRSPVCVSASQPARRIMNRRSSREVRKSAPMAASSHLRRQM